LEGGGLLLDLWGGKKGERGGVDVNISRAERLARVAPYSTSGKEKGHCFCLGRKEFLVIGGLVSPSELQKNRVSFPEIPGREKGNVPIVGRTKLGTNSFPEGARKKRK